MPTIGLSVQLASLEDVGRTDTGRKRDRNEDTFAIWTEFQRSVTPLIRQVSGRGIYVLCDGMGGHEGGEIASALAANTLVEFSKPTGGQRRGCPQPILSEKACVRRTRQSTKKTSKKCDRAGNAWAPPWS
ncbi:MAG: hypothetical protein HC925_01085 [Coleofasciculaceae cyanobacterium SM2_3_26]|nr:hypothetical protein [Coleofasciculaceae cyanobacterium SM2_3_26]